MTNATYTILFEQVTPALEDGTRLSVRLEKWSAGDRIRFFLLIGKQEQAPHWDWIIGRARYILLAGANGDEALLIREAIRQFDELIDELERE